MSQRTRRPYLRWMLDWVIIVALRRNGKHDGFDGPTAPGGSAELCTGRHGVGSFDRLGSEGACGR